MNKFSSFLERISQLNGLVMNPPIQFYFYTGMLFSSRDKWWDDFGLRTTLHEGIDITFYGIDGGKLDYFDETILIPAFDNGKILNICGDFLGQTLVVEHPESKNFVDNTIIYTYAHIRPNTPLKIGGSIQKGESIGTVCNTIRNPKLPPHLHFSCFEICSKIPFKSLNWDLFSNIEKNQCFHPLFL